MYEHMFIDSAVIILRLLKLLLQLGQECSSILLPEKGNNFFFFTEGVENPRSVGNVEKHELCALCKGTLNANNSSFKSLLQRTIIM